MGIVSRKLIPIVVFGCDTEDNERKTFSIVRLAWNIINIFCNSKQLYEQKLSLKKI